MELLFTNILQKIVFPPGVVLLLMLLGIVFLRYRPFLAKVLLWLGLLTGYLLSTPFLKGVIIQQLQSYPALSPSHITERVEQSHAGAIVVLSANRYKDSPEYGHDTVGAATLERIRYAAYLYHTTGLPLVVSGGYVLDTTGDSLAVGMAESLQHDFGVKGVWLEDRSHTTAENASYTAQLLKPKGIDTILLVTHAYHMPRAVKTFEKNGLKVIPAPTGFSVQRNNNEPLIMLWLPSASALYGSYLVLHELAGMAWYAIRY